MDINEIRRLVVTHNYDHVQVLAAVREYNKSSELCDVINYVTKSPVISSALASRVFALQPAVLQQYAYIAVERVAPTLVRKVCFTDAVRILLALDNEDISWMDADLSDIQPRYADGVEDAVRLFTPAINV